MGVMNIFYEKRKSRWVTDLYRFQTNLVSDTSDLSRTPDLPFVSYPENVLISSNSEKIPSSLSSEEIHILSIIASYSSWVDWLQQRTNITY